MPDIGFVYKIVGPSGKAYVGATRTSLSRRFSSHKMRSNSGSTSSLHEDMRAYGADKFKISVLEKTILSNLDRQERWWVNRLGTLYPNGYNETSGGIRNCVATQHVLDKISSAVVGKIPEHVKEKNRVRQSLRVTVEDSFSGEAMEFASQADCCKFFGVSRKRISNFVRTGCPLFRKRWKIYVHARRA